MAENQSAFVQVRPMVHNVLICHDLLRLYNRQTSPRCMVKIDLRKAYDMVSWEFVEEALKGYGFPHKFIKLIILCVTSPKHIIKVNGEGYGFFDGKRGLRHGDPMPPLLFVLVMEYLSRTLKYISEFSNFKFHPICKQLKLTHLIFACDLIIFCKGTPNPITMEALSHFSKVTGLVANMDKSSIFVAGVDDHMKDTLVQQTGFILGTFPIRYLGFPISSKKCNKMECYQLIDKIITRINTVYSKQLSYAGRLQVVTAVLFSLHSFCGSSFILPQSVLKEVDKKY